MESSEKKELETAVLEYEKTSSGHNPIVDKSVTWLSRLFKKLGQDEPELTALAIRIKEYRIAKLSLELSRFKKDFGVD